ncbi:MAG: hypothetical protein IJN77_07450 [Oscillospiraceae bacterium]|nr:hypothetical protein [Oscillospiraceae bacterium]
MKMQQLWRVAPDLYLFLLDSVSFLRSVLPVILTIAAMAGVIIWLIYTKKDNAEDALWYYRNNLADWAEEYTGDDETKHNQSSVYIKPKQVLWPLKDIKSVDIDEFKGNLAILAENTGTDYIQTNTDFEFCPQLRRVVCARSGDGLTTHLKMLCRNSETFREKGGTIMANSLYSSLSMDKEDTAKAVKQCDKEIFVFDASAYIQGKAFEKQLYTMLQSVFDSEMTAGEFHRLINHLGYKNIVFVFDNVGKRTGTILQDFIEKFTGFVKKHDASFIITVYPETLSDKQVKLLDTIDNVLAESFMNYVSEIAEDYYYGMMVSNIFGGISLESEYIFDLYEPERAYHAGPIRKVLQQLEKFHAASLPEKSPEDPYLKSTY